MINIDDLCLARKFKWASPLMPSAASAIYFVSMLYFWNDDVLTWNHEKHFLWRIKVEEREIDGWYFQHDSSAEKPIYENKVAQNLNETSASFYATACQRESLKNRWCILPFMPPMRPGDINQYDWHAAKSKVKASRCHLRLFNFEHGIQALFFTTYTAVRTACRQNGASLLLIIFMKKL